MHRSILTLACLLFAAGAPADPTIPGYSESETMALAPSARGNMVAHVKAHIPLLRVPTDPSAWATEAAHLRQAFRDTILYRNYPPEWLNAPLQVEWLDTITTPHGYSIRKLRYQVVPGLWIPALLYLPDKADPASPSPGILNVNGHVGPPGKAIEYEQLRCINLAKRGIAALHPEWFNFGDLNRPGYNHMQLAYLDLAGVTGVGIFTLALQRAVDVLVQYPGIDPARIGMTGLSGGGWQTIFAGAADTRISAIAPNAGYIGLGVRTGNIGDIGDLEQIPTDLLTVLDYTHLTALLAPRPTLLIYNDKDECCFAAERAILDVYEPLIPLWELHGAADRFAAHVNSDPGTHNYDLDNRQQFYAFIKRTFMPDAAWDEKEMDSAAEVLTPEALSVPLPADNETFASLALGLLAAREEKPALRHEEQVEGLRQVLRYQPPVEATLEVHDKFELGALAGARDLLRVDSHWALPVISVTPAHAAQAATTHIVLADEGLDTARQYAEKLLPLGAPLTLVEPIFFGANRPAGGSSYQFAMLYNATGSRLLGLQIAQFIAAARFVHRRDGASVAVHAIGGNAAYVALAASVLEPELLQEVFIEQAPQSLTSLIREGVDYQTIPALFTFDLLRYDFPMLRQLSETGGVKLQPASPQ
jgi:dienelactone hydrolase